MGRRAGQTQEGARTSEHGHVMHSRGDVADGGTLPCLVLKTCRRIGAG